MSNIKMLHAKLHRSKVTQTDLHYVGSISIDEDWMNAVGMLPLEEVHVCNIDNGKRFMTYAIPAPAGSGTIGPNGPCSYLCDVGDRVVIFSYQYEAREKVHKEGHVARVLTFGEDGKPDQYLKQKVGFADGVGTFVNEEHSLETVLPIAEEVELT